MLLAIGGCTRKAPPGPVLSPDGNLTLVTTIDPSRADPAAYLCVVFEIRDPTGKVLHKENTRASDLHRWKMSWDSNEVIRLESADIGTRFWSRQPNGEWKKN